MIPLAIAGVILLLALGLIVTAPGGPSPLAVTLFLMAGVVLGLGRRMRAGGPDADRAFARPSEAAYASDGWRREIFVMTGLEEDGEALREYTDEAGMYGYRREAGSDRYSWRFVRDKGS